MDVKSHSLCPKGYKQTEVGVIPEDWELTALTNLSAFITKGSTPTTYGFKWQKSGVLFLRSECVSEDGLDLAQSMFISPEAHFMLRRSEVEDGDILVTITGNVGRVVRLIGVGRANLNQHIARVRVISPNVNASYIYHFLSQPVSRERFTAITTGQAYPQISLQQVRNTEVALPTKAEQEAIAQALSDADALIESLEQLLAKKRRIKQGAMQELLTGKKRLPGFSGEWEVSRLGDVTDCLDNLRIPLNETQRNQMTGDYPYCGANGVLGFVNNYVVNDDIILIAEDGGYFDEYDSRPIAYRMIGKCWVNNHAHILKAKAEHDQGFIYYSLVHKNVLSYLASGTRAKLNKSEMTKIEILLPQEKNEQIAIAAILSDMDVEIDGLDEKLTKARQIKQGMMQELLTGRIRLI